MAGVDIRGRAIAITGASSGIGAAAAVECARAGMGVALMARRADRLEEVAARVRALGGRAVCVPGSVERVEDCRQLVDECVREFGSIHAVFANAGIGYEGSFPEMTDGDLRRVFEVNFFGSINAARPAVERMRAQGSGHVLFCSSCLSKITLPYYGAYCATKACQEVFARTMRSELKGSGIHVSSVHPIGTKTELFDGLERDSPRGNRLSKGPDYFLQPAERVGRAVVWCLRHPHREVWTGLAVRVGFTIAHAAPGLTDRVVGALVAKRLRMGQPRSAPGE